MTVSIGSQQLGNTPPISLAPAPGVATANQPHLDPFQQMPATQTDPLTNEPTSVDPYVHQGGVIATLSQPITGPSVAGPAEGQRPGDMEEALGPELQANPADLGLSIDQLKERRRTQAMQLGDQRAAQGAQVPSDPAANDGGGMIFGPRYNPNGSQTGADAGPRPMVEDAQRDPVPNLQPSRGIERVGTGALVPAGQNIPDPLRGNPGGTTVPTVGADIVDGYTIPPEVRGAGGAAIDAHVAEQKAAAAATSSAGQYLALGAALVFAWLLLRGGKA